MTRKLALLFFLTATLAHANTFTAASCSTADVQAAVNLASDGDTVMIPNGTCTWTTGITTTKQIWIRAQNYTAVLKGSLSRNVTLINASTTVPLFSMTSGNSFHIRISGIYFAESSNPQINDINLNGSGTQIPILDDDTVEIGSRFGNEPGIAALSLGTIGGLMYDAYITGIPIGSCPNGAGCQQGASVHLNSSLGWYTADTLGTQDTNETQNWYVEDSTWINFGQSPDCDDRCRIVMRYNILDGTAGQTHGLTSSVGGRQVEIYNNTIQTSTNGRNIAGRYWWGREGAWYIHDNMVAYQNVGYGNPELFNSIVECNGGVSCANDGSVAYPHLFGTGGPGTGGQQLAWTCNPCTNSKSTSTPVSRPVYIWNNCIIGSGHTLPCTGDSQSNNTSSSFFIVLNRDIFIDAGAPAGYTPAPYPHPLRGGPSVGLSPGSVAFGNVLVGSSSPSTPITLTNSGSAPLTITSIALTGANPADFSQTNNCGSAVAQGGSCTITVKFTPLSAASFSASVTVTDNATGSPQSVSLTGTGTTASPAIGFAPTSITFAGQNVGTSSSPTAITVTNTGGATLTIIGVAISGGNATSFSQTNNCGSVAPAGTCTINVTFSPQVAGALSSSVSVTDNAAGSPQSVPLTGTGNGSAGISFTPTSLPFGNQTVGGTSAAQSTTVKNIGSATLTLSSVTLTGTNSADFAISANTCGGSLTVNSTCLVSVTFTPGATGARTANLTFTDTAPASPQNVALTGTGTQSGTSFSPTSIAFGSQNVSTTSAPSSTTLSNTGSATLNISSITITGTNASDFAISSKTCGATVTASGTCSVSVTFTPGSAGSRSASLSFADDAPGSPQTVPLTGTGVSVTNSLSISPSTITFPSTVVAQTSASQQISVTANPANPGPIVFTSILVSGGNNGDFAIVSNGCPSSLPAASTCLLSVTFTPTATGARASAVVFTDSAAGSPQSVNLSGTGTQAGAVVPATLAFANQPVGTTSGLQALNLFNNGTATLHISSITIGGTNPSYFAVNSSTCGATLAAGATCSINITFTPQTAIAATATVVWADDGPAAPQITNLSGTGTSTALSFNPASVTFPNTAVSSTSAPLTVTVSNTGNGAVTISSIAITGTNASNFAQTNNCGTTLAGNASCIVTIRFTPSANGSRTANLVFTDSAPASPQTVSLQGTGFTPTPAVTLSVASVTFGNQTTGTSSNPQVAILTNTGTATLTISSTSITGTNAGDFGQSSTCGATLAVNASCTYSFVFTPTAAGGRSATFNLTTNAPSSVDHISLSGTGVMSPNGAPAPQVFGD